MNGSPAPPVTDDFKNRINGIGPATEMWLHQAGILTFAELAALAPAEIAVLISDLPGISAERIAEQDWPGQARELAAEPVPVETHRDDVAASGNHQHDVSFTVNLLLNEDNSVRRTQVVDNHSEVEEQWADWNASRLLTFISRQAALQSAETEPEPPITAEAEPEPVSATVGEAVPAATPTTESQAVVPAPAGLGGTLHLLDLEVRPADASGPRRVLREGLPFSVQLSLDLTEVILPNHEPLDCTATVYTKGLGGGPRQTIGEARNTIMPKDQLVVLVPSWALSKGSYRLEAIVTLRRPSAELAAEPGIKTHLEGGILQIY